MADCKFSPYAVALGCVAPVKFKHFRITTGEDNNPFEKILTEKKFITHAINFDAGKSTIKPESMALITQLAQFLDTNPTVKLEIDGHTDSDGDANTNLQLSQARADEVKKQLVAMGIDSNRLATKGFGASKPLQPNTTPEAKANNRRVEFIKM
jgi:outer membrane protein OmpA-like peptidoglycan-associated protein